MFRCLSPRQKWSWICLTEQSLASPPPLAAEYLPTRQLARAFWFVGLALIGTAVLAISAKIKVDLVYVNVTMQTFALFAISALYGSRLAVATVALYLLEGALGMPVFTGTPEKGIGLAYMVGPTGGYLLSYLAAAWIVGRAADKDWRAILSLSAVQCCLQKPSFF